MYSDVVKVATIGCHKSCSLWKARATLLQQYVQSETDLVILPSDPTRGEDITALSIVKVTNLSDYLHSPPSSCADNKVEPEICKRISKKVLGQHGGELIVHDGSKSGIFNKKFENEKDKKVYLPGMIVIGTEVTLTLLVISYTHLAELFKKKVVEKSESYIYYSETKYMLKKEERDQLLEALRRFQNTECQT